MQTPPAGIDYGLQKGSGNNYETVQIQRSVSRDLNFEFVVEIKGDRQTDSFPLLRGPFVQGKPGERFFYIDIGTYAGQQSLSGWRLKVPLSGITWDMIDTMNSNPATILETQVPGTGKNGAPNCATVKPFAGWEIKERSN